MALTLIRSDDADRDGHAADGTDERVKKILAKLAHIPGRRWTYLTIARRALLKGDHAITNPEYRLLVALLGYTDRDLSNCFPTSKTLARVEGLKLQHVKRLLGQLTEKGWIRSRRLKAPSGKLIAGRQFAIPAGILAPWADEWLGPRDFQKLFNRNRR